MAEPGRPSRTEGITPPEDELLNAETRIRPSEVRPVPPSDALSCHSTLTPSQPEDTSIPAGLLNHPIYELVELLGWGGMGIVYKARHRVMDRLVALKVIRPGLVGEPAMITRFRREVRAAARLNHPSIAHAYDAGEAGGAHFLVMEYIKGTNLETVAQQQRPLPFAQACDYARQAALGLQHAHDCHMVHRDIKPQNLMLTPGGQVKILDFGLARFASEVSPLAAGTAELPRPGEEAPGMTPSNALLGTADYLAPEEALDARSADIRADIYSLGCTLYRLLTGQVPFPGGSFWDKLHRHAAHPPIPLEVRQPEVPPALSEFVGRMLAKNPSDRPQTPAEVAHALDAFAARSARHILVVDDNPAVQRNMETLLQREGYTVSVAANGQEALDRLRQGDNLPALILLDLMMPVMDGIEFLRTMRAAPDLAEVPVVIISAVDRTQAASLDAAQYLPKPIQVRELTEAIHRHAAG